MAVSTSPVTGFATIGRFALRGTIMSDGSFRSAGVTYQLSADTTFVTGDSILRLMQETDTTLTATHGIVSASVLKSAIRKAQDIGGRTAGLCRSYTLGEFIAKAGFGLTPAQASKLVAKVLAFQVAA